MSTACSSSVACSSNGCVFPARWHLTVKVWARGHSKASTPLSMHTALVACDYHREHPGNVLDLFPEEQQAMITAGVVRRGRVAPDFSTAEWEFLAVTPERAAAIVRGELGPRKVTLQ